MRKLYNNEFPVMPVGYQNLNTGKNEYFDVFEGHQYYDNQSFSLIQSERGTYCILFGTAPAVFDLAHDQNHRSLGRFKLINTFNTGTVQETFRQIRFATHKTALRGYVYK